MSANIIGIGMDATEIDRIDATIKRYGDRFLRRFSPKAKLRTTRRRNPVPHFAGRFAAKEAAMKALGTGHRKVSCGEILRSCAHRVGRRNCGFTVAQRDAWQF